MAMHHRQRASPNPFTGRRLPANSPYRTDGGDRGHGSGSRGGPAITNMAKKALLIVASFGVFFYIVSSGVDDGGVDSTIVGAGSAGGRASSSANVGGNYGKHLGGIGVVGGEGMHRDRLSDMSRVTGHHDAGGNEDHLHRLSPSSTILGGGGGQGGRFDDEPGEFGGMVGGENSMDHRGGGSGDNYRSNDYIGNRSGRLASSVVGDESRRYGRDSFRDLDQQRQRDYDAERGGITGVMGMDGGISGDGGRMAPPSRDYGDAGKDGTNDDIDFHGRGDSGSVDGGGSLRGSRSGGGGGGSMAGDASGDISRFGRRSGAGSDGNDDEFGGKDRFGSDNGDAELGGRSVTYSPDGGGAAGYSTGSGDGNVGVSKDHGLGGSGNGYDGAYDRRVGGSGGGGGGLSMEDALNNMQDDGDAGAGLGGAGMSGEGSDKYGSDKYGSDKYGSDKYDPSVGLDDAGNSGDGSEKGDSPKYVSGKYGADASMDNSNGGTNASGDAGAYKYQGRMAIPKAMGSGFPDGSLGGEVGVGNAAGDSKKNDDDDDDDDATKGSGDVAEENLRRSDSVDPSERYVDRRGVDGMDGPSDAFRSGASVAKGDAVQDSLEVTKKYAEKGGATEDSNVTAGDGRDERDGKSMRSDATKEFLDPEGEASRTRDVNEYSTGTEKKHMDTRDIVDKFPGSGKAIVTDEKSYVDRPGRESEKESNLCEDDPTFLYKEKPGFDCEFVAKYKPDKCFKLHNGARIGVISCPKSCNMMEACREFNALRPEHPRDVEIVKKSVSEAFGRKNDATKDIYDIQQRSADSKNEASGAYAENGKVSGIHNIEEIGASVKQSDAAEDTHTFNQTKKVDSSNLHSYISNIDEDRPSIKEIDVTKDSSDVKENMDSDNKSRNMSNNEEVRTYAKKSDATQNSIDVKTNVASDNKVSSVINTDEVSASINKSDVTNDPDEVEKGLGSDDQATIADQISPVIKDTNVTKNFSDIKKDADFDDKTSILNGDEAAASIMDKSATKESSDVKENPNSDQDASADEDKVEDVGKEPRKSADIGEEKKSHSSDLAVSVEKDPADHDSAYEVKESAKNNTDTSKSLYDLGKDKPSSDKIDGEEPSISDGKEVDVVNMEGGDGVANATKELVNVEVPANSGDLKEGKNESTVEKTNGDVDEKTGGEPVNDSGEKNDSGGVADNSDKAPADEASGAAATADDEPKNSGDVAAEKKELSKNDSGDVADNSDKAPAEEKSKGGLLKKFHKKKTEVIDDAAAAADEESKNLDDVTAEKKELSNEDSSVIAADSEKASVDEKTEGGLLKKFHKKKTEVEDDAAAAADEESKNLDDVAAKKDEPSEKGSGHVATDSDKAPAEEKTKGGLLKKFHKKKTEVKDDAAAAADEEPKNLDDVDAEKKGLRSDLVGGEEQDGVDSAKGSAGPKSADKVKESADEKQRPSDNIVTEESTKKEGDGDAEPEKSNVVEESEIKEPAEVEDTPPVPEKAVEEPEKKGRLQGYLRKKKEGESDAGESEKEKNDQ